MTEQKPKVVGTEDWKVQLSKKINGDLWNFRASSAAEFAELTKGLAEVADEALNNVGAFVQAALAKTIQTDEQSRRSESTESTNSGGSARKSTGRKATSSVPSCAHGLMKDLSDRNYRHRYYCTASNRDEQCDPRDY